MLSLTLKLNQPNVLEAEGVSRLDFKVWKNRVINFLSQDLENTRFMTGGIYRGVILYIIHYFTLMFQKCTLFTLFFIFVHYTLFLSNMYIILLIIHYFSNFFVKRVVQDPRRGQ